MEAAYRDEGGLDKIPAYVDDTGEVNWLVDDAMHMEVPVPVIAQAVMQLISSRDDDKSWARAIAMMRHGFGGHKYGHDPATVRERRQERFASVDPGQPLASQSGRRHISQVPGSPAQPAAADLHLHRA